MTGVDSAVVGEVAAEAGLTVHELFGQRASLEDVFMELTGGSVDYTSGRTGAAEPPAAAPVGQEVR